MHYVFLRGAESSAKQGMQFKHAFDLPILTHR